MTPEQQSTATHALYTALDGFEYGKKTGQSALAQALTDIGKGVGKAQSKKISKQLVNSWLSTKVPINYVVAVEQLLGVDRRIIRPDLIEFFDAPVDINKK